MPRVKVKARGSNPARQVIMPRLPDHFILMLDLGFVYV